MLHRLSPGCTTTVCSGSDSGSSAVSAPASVASGGSAVTQPPNDLAATVNAEFGKVTNVVGAARLALLLEETAADTYLAAIGAASSKDAINLAGSIYPIDRQHVSVLRFVLGEYPVPETFGTTAKSVA